MREAAMMRSTTHTLTPQRIVVIAALALSLSGCTVAGGIAPSAAPEATAASGTSAIGSQPRASPSASTCAVTQPPDPPLVPPPSVGSTQPPARQFWYGNDALWLTLPADGVMGSRKVMWWRTLPGMLTVEGRRLDGPAPPLEADLSGGYGDEGFQASGITFPTAGCWEVVGRVANHALRFVVTVYPRLYWAAGGGCQYQPDAISGSDAILLGVVEGTTPDRPGFAWRTVRVQQTWKGSLPINGRLDVLQSTSEEPPLQDNHSYLLFLQSSAGYPWRINCPARSLGEVNGEQITNLQQNQAIPPLWSAATLQAFDALIRQGLSAPTPTTAAP